MVIHYIKKNQVILRRTNKVLDKIQHTYVILKSLRIKNKFSTWQKWSTVKSTENIIFHCKILKHFSQDQ